MIEMEITFRFGNFCFSQEVLDGLREDIAHEMPACFAGAIALPTPKQFHSELP